MCNNSTAGRTGLIGGQAGYQVTSGYDEVTGLGSLDVAAFINNFNGPAIAGVSAAPQTIYGDDTVIFTVTLTADAPVGGALISLSSSAPSVVPSSSLTISAGSTSGQTTVTAGNPAVSSQAIITADYNGGSAQTTVTVNPATAVVPTITFSVPNHTYGDAPFSVAATSNSSGAITYSVQSGNATISGSTVTLTGIGLVTVIASQAAAGNYKAGSQAATFSVAAQAQTITFPQPISSVNYGAAPIALSASASSGLPVTFGVVSGPALVTGSTLNITGAGTVVVAANQAGSGYFAAAPAVTRSILVNMDIPAVGFLLTPNLVMAQNNITLTTTVTSAVSMPTGSVTFYDGSTPVGSATLVGGAAAMTTAALAAGQHSISAVYNGDTNFEMVTSRTVSETVVDFGLSAVGNSSQTVQPGASAIYTFAFSLTGASTLPAPVAFAANGLPTGASVSYSPPSLATGGGATNIAVTIQMPSQSAKLGQNRHLGEKLPLFAFCMLLPLAGTMRRYKRLSRLLSVAMILLGMLGIAMLSGCGGGATLNSQVHTQTASYNIVLTATSGTLSHSANVTLAVE